MLLLLCCSHTMSALQTTTPFEHLFWLVLAQTLEHRKSIRPYLEGARRLYTRCPITIGLVTCPVSGPQGSELSDQEFLHHGWTSHRGGPFLVPKLETGRREADPARGPFLVPKLETGRRERETCSPMSGINLSTSSLQFWNEKGSSTLRCPTVVPKFLIREFRSLWS